MDEALVHVQDNLPNGVRLTFRPDAEAGLTTNGSSDALVQCGTTPASRRPALMANSIESPSAGYLPPPPHASSLQ